MAKYREVPKSLVFFNSDELSEDTELIPPELLFYDYENENLIPYPGSGAPLGELSPVTLASPETLFGKPTFKKIKLKSPDELFGKAIKQNVNSKEGKNLSAKKDKKSEK